jgi:rhodanese-related sulfurtransferase
MSGMAPDIDAASVPDDARILDVREPGEWVAGHVAGSQHLPIGEVAERVSEIDDEEGTIVVVCRSGYRSAQVAAWLQGQGYDAVNLAGGLDAWAQAGRPLVTDAGAPGRVA